MSLRERLRSAETGWLRRVSAKERHRPLRAVMLIATRLADGWGLGLLIPLALVLGGRDRGVTAIGLGTASALSVAIVVQSIKWTVRRRRPMGLTLANPISAPDAHAFPSGHAAQAFGMVVVASWLAPWLGVVTLVVAACVALSRMFFGLHYPTDVVAGAIIGVVVTLLVIALGQEIGYADWLMRLRPAP